MRLIKKEHEIERLVLKKIELEKIIQKKEEINNQYKQKFFFLVLSKFFLFAFESNLELEIINEEKTTRDMNSAKILQNALHTGGVAFNILSFKTLLRILAFRRSY